MYMARNFWAHDMYMYIYIQCIYVHVHVFQCVHIQEVTECTCYRLRGRSDDGDNENSVKD